MKKSSITFLMITILSFLSSCSNIIDEAYLQNDQNDYTSPYMGKWVGNYTGDGNGTLILNVTKNGSIEVTRTVNGNVQETYYTNLLGGGAGSINPSSSVNSGFTLYGSLKTKSGTWKQQNWNGNWSVTKQ